MGELWVIEVLGVDKVEKTVQMRVTKVPPRGPPLNPCCSDQPKHECSHLIPATSRTGFFHFRSTPTRGRTSRQRRLP